MLYDVVIFLFNHQDVIRLIFRYISIDLSIHIQSTKKLPGLSRSFDAFMCKGHLAAAFFKHRAGITDRHRHRETIETKRLKLR